MTLPSAAREQLIHVLLIESRQVQSQVLSSALRRHLDFQVRCCGAELSECIEALESCPAEVALLSYGPAGKPSQHYGILRGLHAAYPQLGLIFLCDTYDRELVVNALHCGARGLFCCVRQPLKALCRCIHSVREGQIWINTEQLQYVIEALLQNPASHVVNAKGEVLLTAREERLVGLVAEGLINREIARGLKISENTVKKGLLRIYDKLGVSNRVELVLYALTHRDASSGERNPPLSPAHPTKPPRTTSYSRMPETPSVSLEKNPTVLENVS